ncbi:MAG: DUF4340 domain-containing protein [Planctomycetota bacterium]|jgi:hypothetical protein
MQSGKTLVMLVAALALAGVGWYLASDERAGWQRESVAASGDPVLPDLAELEQRLRTIEFSDATQTRRVELRGETWTLTDKDGYPAKQSTVVGLFRAVGDLERVEAKTANPARHDRLGLVDPAQGGAARKVRFLDEADQELASLLLGESYRGLANPALFVRAVNEDQCWLVEGQVSTRTSDFDWLDRDLFALGGQRVARAELQLPEGGYAVSRETPDAYEFGLEELPLGQQAKSAFLVSAVAKLADNFRFQDVARSDSVGIAENAEASTALLTTFDDLVLEVSAQRLGPEAGDEVWVALQARLDENLATEESRADLESEVLELNAKFDGWMFRLEATPATAMFRPLSELIEADEQAELPEGAAGPVLPGFDPNAPGDAAEPPAEAPADSPAEDGR